MIIPPMSSPGRNMLNSNIDASLETDHQTYTNIKGTDHAGLKAGNYAAQIQSNGDLTKWAYSNGTWNSVGSYLTTQNVCLYNVATMNFGYDPDGAYFIEWFFAENNKYHLKFMSSGIQFAYYNGSSWSVLWNK